MAAMLTASREGAAVLGIAPFASAQARHAVLADTPCPAPIRVSVGSAPARPCASGAWAVSAIPFCASIADWPNHGWNSTWLTASGASAGATARSPCAA